LPAAPRSLAATRSKPGVFITILSVARPIRPSPLMATLTMSRPPLVCKLDEERDGAATLRHEALTPLDRLMNLFTSLATDPRVTKFDVNFVEQLAAARLERRIELADSTSSRRRDGAVVVQCENAEFHLKRSRFVKACVTPIQKAPKRRLVPGVLCGPPAPSIQNATPPFQDEWIGPAH
jgi:hypothetical protein